MITTQSVAQSTTTKRRGSIHQKNLEPYATQNQIPTLQAANTFVNGNTAPSIVNSRPLESFQARFVSLFPEQIQRYLPEVNLKVTALCYIWYITSSVSSNLSKGILGNFPHPVALTELQFLISASLCLLFVTLANFLSSEKRKKSSLAKALLCFPEGILPKYANGNFKDCILGRFLFPCKLALTTTFPMGIFQLVGHITSHKATSLIPVSLVHSVKALSPIMTVSYYRFFKGKQYSVMTYFTLIPLICGVIITCWSTHGHKKPNEVNGESGFFVGLIFALTSMVIFVSQNIFAKGILTVKKDRGILPSKNLSTQAGIQNEKEYSPLQLDKITILFYCSCIGFLLTLPIFVSNELINLNSEKSVLRDLNLKVLMLVLIHGVTHFFQAMLAFQLIGMLSPVNYSIANIMKRIVIIGVALIWESHLSYRQIFGLGMTIMGLYGYDRWGGAQRN
ncbi:LAFE_0A03510g1_1 [Lachancea fermentati]|uniref:LAFE_0A03510g1_1 n=1 Tax=Lachancea fermentati TaxID=4955 RepID=A0A1G4M6J3_LACFM|nr:LAFE_0A03510g1_1 [Lachancea fermentati]